MKKVLFTGARSGIAHATIKRLINKNYIIYLTVHTESQLKAVRKTYKKYDNVVCLKIDVTKKEDLIKVEGLNIDILISNAAIGYGGSISEISMDLVRENFEVNVFANFQLIQMVLRQMIKKNNGKIIVMSSLIRLLPYNFLGVYSATKASISNLMFTLKNELKYLDTDVKVILLEPGAYHTGSNQVMLDNKYDWMNIDSYFSSCLEEIKKCENNFFNLVERKSLNTITKTLEKIIESENPKFLYRTPLTHAITAKLCNFIFF